jgi:hypothetical protein
MLKRGGTLLVVLINLVLCLNAQDSASPKQPLEHVLGTVTAVDANAHTVTVKEDKTATSYTLLLGETKTLLKVEPGAKDLKNAVRITADDLQAGDRVDARGTKSDTSSNTLAARSVVLMSGRALQQAHQAQAAEWQHSTAGVVISVDAAAGKLNATMKTPEGAKPIAIATTGQTEFTRYAPENPKTPAPSQLTQIQAGDQVRVIGDKSADGATMTAQKIYSGAFRTISGTVTSIGSDGKSVTVKDLATKKSVEIVLGEDAAVHKLPPMMAMMLARRFNPSYKPAEGAPNGGTSPAGAQRPNGSSADGQAPAGEASGQGQRMGGGGGARGNGDISQMLERAPKIASKAMRWSSPER